MATKPTEATGDGFPRGIGAPATRALHGAGFTKLEQLTQATEAELMALHGFGPKALRILQAALQEQGLAMAQPAVEKQPKKPPKRSAG
jgi:predicted flap endonuclease-1-like 5' DNA nuclease